MPTRIVTRPRSNFSQSRSVRALGFSQSRSAYALLWQLAIGALLMNAVVSEGLAQTPPVAPAPAAAPTAPADPNACSDVDAVRSGRVSGVGLEGSAPRVQDAALLQEGVGWDSPGAVKIKAVTGKLTIDLRSMRTLQHFVLQGDDNDTYVIEGSEDGIAWKPVWNAPVSSVGQGLRTRFGSAPAPVQARFLRVSGVGGDTFYSVSELRAYCAKPKPWGPKLSYPPEKTGWAWIDNPRMVFVKAVLATLGTLLLLSYWLLRKRPHVFLKTRNVTLALVGILSFASWWNLGHYHFDHYEHIWEHYHYYIGAKYGPELRYARLYECTAAADLSDGLRFRVKKRKMRDLAHSNELGTSEAIIKDPTRCTSHFSKERWEEFRKDIRFFRGRFSADRWDQSQNDHGYNGTPVWAIAGRLLTDYGELNWEKIQRIAWIDSALLVVMWIGALWAFGWQATCAALIYWGTNFPARFYWNGGSMLRYDWIMWIVLGICFLKKDKPFLGGAALTYATLLRVFPGFIVAAVILKVLAAMVRERRFFLSRTHQWFAAGCIAAMLVLIPASSWATGGLDAWPEFAQNSQKHLKTALTNNMGLKTVLGYDFPTRAIHMRDDSTTDPFKGWKDARGFYYDASKPVLFALLLLFCVMLGRAGDREPDWSAASMGTGLIVISSELTCYYYGFLLTYGFLWRRHKWPAIIMSGLAAVTCAVSELPWNDDHFAAMSLATVIAIFVSVWIVAFGKREPVTVEPPIAAEKLDQSRALQVGYEPSTRQ